MIAGAAVLLAAGRAGAQSLRDNHYTLDVFQGPVLAPSDVIGIGGAYAGVGEGIAGMVANAAAPAVRESWNVAYFNWDVSPSISLPFNVLGTRDDFDNSGSNDLSFTDYLYATLGLLVQYGPVGVGVNTELSRYSLVAPKGAVSATVTLGKYHALLAVRLLGDQLMIGGGARVCTLGIAPHNTEANLTMVGAAPEIGVLVRPDWQSWRVGATLRFPVQGGRLYGGDVDTSASGVRTSANLVLPDHVVLPWEIEVGASVQVGPRPLNPPWIDPHDQEAALHRSFLRKRREREAAEEAELARIGDPGVRAARKAEIDAEEKTRRAQEEADEARIAGKLESERRARALNWPREHLLLTVELLATGPVENGVSLGRFLAQSQTTGDPSLVGSSGASWNFSPRFGVETEPIPGRMHTRAGSYYEPSRIDTPLGRQPALRVGAEIQDHPSGDRVGRQHFTFGADLRLFSTTFWGLIPETTYKVQSYADLAPRYQSVSVGLGVWR